MYMAEADDRVNGSVMMRVLDHETWRIPSFPGSIIHLISETFFFSPFHILIFLRVLLVIDYREKVTWTAWITIDVKRREKKGKKGNGFGRRQPAIHNKWTSTPSFLSSLPSSDNPWFLFSKTWWHESNEYEKSRCEEPRESTCSKEGRR